MGVDDHDGSTEGMRRLLRELEQDRPVPLPLEVVADADQAEARLRGIDEVDAHGADDLAVAHEEMRKMTGLELVRVVLVVGVPRQQRREDRITTDGVIGDPIIGRLRRPQRVAIAGIGHVSSCRIRSRLPV
jgi:hypothetical protein